jgi:hypothetical protein
VRQAILVIVLVAASFLGGAFVNGPGLHWVQQRVLRSLGLTEGCEIASVNLKPTGAAETAQGEVELPPGAEAPRVSPLGLAAKGEASVHGATDRRPELQLTAGSKPGKSDLPRSSMPLLSSSESLKPPAAPTNVPGGDPAASGLEAPSTKSVPPAPISRAPAISDVQVTPAVLDSVAALLPLQPQASTSRPASPSQPTVAKPAGDANEEWAVLESKMQTLGVSRFTIEAEPHGRVVFSCLIPLAGRQAVAQRFEAEGDDIVHATRAALRRVGLWRATQTPAN